MARTGVVSALCLNQHLLSLRILLTLALLATQVQCSRSLLHLVPAGAEQSLASSDEVYRSPDIPWYWIWFCAFLILIPSALAAISMVVMIAILLFE